MLLCLATLTLALTDHTIKKRVLPIHTACRPDSGICRKGDWIAENIASCHYVKPSGLHPFKTCDAQKDTIFETADVEIKDRCKPDSGKQIRCGEEGTNTRCVCSDKKVHRNKCKCQYWPPEDIGAHAPAFCTAYYSGGLTGLHQWACCNNCNDSTPNTCDAETWQGGGSFISYCNSCGQNTGGGQVKYYFNCGGCESQQYCSKHCSKGFKIIDKIVPGLCWKWLECFKGCCLKSSTQP